MPNQPSPELIPESIDAQLPSGTRLRFCFDEPLMTSDAGLLLLAGHAARSGDIARIATALAPKLKAPAPGERKLRTPEHSTQVLLTQRVMQMVGGYPDGNDSNLLRHDPVLQMLVGKATPGTAEAGARKLYEDIYSGRGRAELYIKDHKLGLVSDRLSCTRKEGNAMRLLCSSLAYRVLEGFRRVALAGTQLARATFGEVRMKIFKLAARMRVMKTRVEVHLAARHPGSSLVAQIIGQALRIVAPRRPTVRLARADEPHEAVRPRRENRERRGGAMPERDGKPGFERRSAPSTRRNSFKHPPSLALPAIHHRPCWLHE
ncbi:MAG TPA: hypothetical protein DIT13_05475 [Verrucomicrobiales bacterium]|nr:hypothetical protein [Verrucomicrobiales bacterium]HRK16569.1 transposase [Prosthecobacter sp.]